MRRLFKTLPGKLLCQVLAAILLLPSISLALAVRAEASQTLSKRLWAVMPFVDRLGGKMGGPAADRLAEELGKRQEEFRPPIEVLSSDTVNRTIGGLQLIAPVTDETSLLRVGQELRAESLVRGEVLNYRVVNVPGGRQAQVIMRVEVINVASDLAINGAAIAAQSTIRPAASDESLLNEALSEGGSMGVSQILSHTLPSATVLNTVVGSALINEGTRSGFADGQMVIVQRGREQVATGRVRDVEPDLATVDVVSFTKGISPGDKVTVVFKVPSVSPDFPEMGHGPIIHKGPHTGGNGQLISLLLLVGLGAVLLGHGNASSQSTLGSVVAEPTLYPEINGSAQQNPAGQAAVRLTWRADLFSGGASQRLAYQIYRSDFPSSAVQVVFSGTAGYDTSTNRDPSFTWYNANHNYVGTSIAQVSAGLGCPVLAPSTPGTIPTGCIPGRPYSYSVSEVFQISSTNLPISQSTTGGGGTSTATGGTASSTAGGTTTGTGTTGTGTGGTTTGTGTGATATGGTATATGTGTGTATATGGTATGTATGTGSTATGSSECTFEEQPQPAGGEATPLNPIGVVSPSDKTTITAPTTFSFNSVVNTAYPAQFQYVLQFSTQPNFAAGPNTYTSASFISGATSVLSFSSVDTAGSAIPVAIQQASLVYWRVGARSTLDNPGPVQDISGQRYIFSPARQFLRLTTPPPASAAAQRLRSNAARRKIGR